MREGEQRGLRLQWPAAAAAAAAAGPMPASQLQGILGGLNDATAMRADRAAHQGRAQAAGQHEAACLLTSCGPWRRGVMPTYPGSAPHCVDRASRGSRPVCKATAPLAPPGALLRSTAIGAAPRRQIACSRPFRDGSEPPAGTERAVLRQRAAARLFGPPGAPAPHSPQSKEL